MTKTIAAQRKTFQSFGCEVEDGQPDFSHAREIFQVFRAWAFSIKFAPLLATHRHELKDTVIWNVEEGLKLTGADVGEAEIKRGDLYHRVRQFMETRHFLVLPSTQVPPFDVTQPTPPDQRTKLPPMSTDARLSDITVTGAGDLRARRLTDEGLPVGIQIVGRHQDEWGVLQLAHAFEQATGFGKHRPPVTQS